MLGDAASGSDASVSKNAYMTVERRAPGEILRLMTPLNLEMNNNWAGNAFSQNQYKYVVVPFRQLPNPQEHPLPNELNPDKEDVSLSLKGKIEEATVREYLSTPLTKIVDASQKLSSVSGHTVLGKGWSAEIPQSLWGNRSGENQRAIGRVFSISLEQIQIPNPNETFYGQLQVWDTSKNEPFTESFTFRIDSGGRCRFTQTDLDVVYFKVEKAETQFILLCMLFKNVGEFRTCHAVGYSSLFEKRDDKAYVVLPKKFKDGWALVQNGDLCAAVEQVVSQGSGCIRLASKFTMKSFHCDSLDWTYSWMENPSSPLLAMPIMPEAYWPLPVISLSGIRVFLSSFPKNAFVSLKAYLVRDVVKNFTLLEARDSLRQFVTDRSSGEVEFQSSWVPAGPDVQIPEAIRIWVDKTPSPTTHLVLLLQVWNERKEVSVMKVAIVPIDKTFEDLKQKFAWYDTKNVPKDYLKHPKIPKKAYVQCNISIPPLYFPPESFASIVKSNEPATFPKDATVMQLGQQLIPYTAKVLTNLTESSFTAWIEFLSKVPPDSLKALNSWIFHIFAPKAILKDNFVEQFCMVVPSVATSLLVDVAKTKPEQMSKKSKDKHKSIQDQRLLETILRAERLTNQLVEALPVVFHILLVVILEKHGTFSEDSLFTCLEAIVDFIVDSIPYIRKDKKTANDAIAHLSRMVFLTTPLFEFASIERVIFRFMYKISELRRQKPDTDSLYAQLSFFTFNFLRPFAYTPAFAVGGAQRTKKLDIHVTYSPFNRMFSQLFLAISQVFEVSHIDPLSRAVDFLSRMAPEIEELPPDVAAHVAFSLFPIVPFVAGVFDSPRMKKQPDIQGALVPFLLCILSNSTEEHLKGYFHTLAGTFQQQFISFLESMVQVIVNDAKNDIKNHLCYFDLVTRKLLQVLIYVAPELKNSMKQVVKLLNTLWNEYQTPANFPIFFNFCAQAVEYHACERSLITMLLDRVNSQLHSARCLATALLSRQFYADFVHNNNIVLSSIDTMDSLTAILLQTTPEEISKFFILISRIDDLADSYGSDEFTSTLRERMKAAQVIATVVNDQKKSRYAPEVRAKQCMRIADQYRMFPTMRLKWLQECLKINKETGDLVSAFVTQLHIIALTDAVFGYVRQKSMKYPREEKTRDPPAHLCVVRPISSTYPKYSYPHKQEYLDFSFMPELLSEIEIDFDSMQDVSFSLLSDFNQQQLLAELQHGVELGLQIGANYTARLLLSLQLRVQYISRNFTDSSDICNKLSEAFAGITSVGVTYEIPYSFFLVEHRQADSQVTREIYCSQKTSLEEFIAKIDSRERFGDLHPNKCALHVGRCSGPGVCVIPLEPIDNVPVGGEYPHCWRRFRSKMSLSNYLSTNYANDEITVIEVVAKDNVPHYRMATSVESFTYKNVSFLDCVKESADEAAAALDKVRSEFDIWFEQEENFTPPGVTVDSLFGAEQHKFGSVLDSALKAQDCVYERLKILNGKLPRQASEIAGELQKHFDEFMSVFRRSSKETPHHTAIAQSIPEYERILSEYAKTFGLAVTPARIYESRPNPMNVTFSFEK